MLLRLLFLLPLLLALAAGPARAQASGPLDSLQTAYPFLVTSANHIENADIGLQRFYGRLRQLPRHPADLGGRVRVVHLGDSHLQADIFSGRVRQELQRTYGNAGRGLAFPFRVARADGSPSFRTAATAGQWQARRVVGKPDSLLPVGLAGFVLTTTDSGAAFSLSVSPLRRPNYAFNKLTLLRRPGPTAFDWQVRSARGRRLGTLAGSAPGVATTLVLDSLRDFVELRATRASSRQTGAQLYGLLLDNGQPGVVYHTIGVNGAAVRHYNRAPLFFEQLPVLAPDLLILSLGTNDAYEPGFNPAAFERQLDTLVSRLRRRCPGADVLLTAPADSYRRHGARNPDLARLRTVLRAYAQAHDLAYWDFAAVQGGYGSMRAWQAHGLAANDLVHFTNKGYDVQGLLLYLALQDGFAAFPLR
ncbi:GDSL-type esterase/lipase family protein [Hymenobacter cheonanensis]|uniref:GDSL-type esterase/lipase family protein n=1 Tax=Hymenobacter sp. CA2-7 TaxID=3063993 RepID=UPI00271249E0|nr:GDSL-type esterase/lipase family protein [Hymenobacter sp. CA2-7]MDO7887858.1 GDSL-type esterase/lipase family protein [Hymenobacter sp. CA2-7]